ncbi:MAG TPA: VOC family protein [Candidatus Binatia bacterium]|nr:VOC family protein [Candidatus Binatia bacterium]
MRLNHLTIIVTDLERSKTFYEALGLEPIVYSPPRYARFLVPANDATFSIEVTPAAKRMGGEQAQIFFECDDLDQRCAELAMAGVTFEQQPTDMPYLWREARLVDPDGHDIRLYSAGKNRLDPPWRLPRKDQALATGLNMRR